MLNWASRFNVLTFFDSNAYNTNDRGFEVLLAAGVAEWVDNDTDDPLKELQRVHDARKDWVFGHICYDYKNVLEPRLSSSHESVSGFPDIRFYIPETVCYITSLSGELMIETTGSPDEIYDAITKADNFTHSEKIPSLKFSALTDKQTYIETIDKLRAHIAAGDCYEINYCTCGYVDDVVVDPIAAYSALNKLSPAPFAAYYRLDDKYLMCASPERYLKKTGTKILSQPIKGTARRDSDAVKDNEIRNALSKDTKELAENVMIVDLVRNDLARSCETGSIVAEELFGVYSFPQVHQLISTISGTLRKGVPFTDAIRYSFPMGSMTGAPKYKVMQLIEQYEQMKRELFAGTVGYITPDGDFDFNVVIRSLFYNERTKRLSYQTGGAITFDSDPEKEYAEMRLKAWALERIFE